MDQHIIAALKGFLIGLIWLIGMAAGMALNGCSTLTTPLRDCKSMCAGKVEFFQSESEGQDQHCVCREGVK